ncbi:MAG: VOC family protein [Chloroflexia bacterium]
MPKNFELTGPAFVSFLVRDEAASVAFYEKTLGFRRDPEVFPRGVGFLTTTIPFAITQAPPNVDLDAIPSPPLVPAIWLKTAHTQTVHDALVEASVTILKPPTDGRFGRQFTFADPDGYAITIYDRDAPPDGWNQ